jgi:predicted alpha/beta hydrolase family esterase
MQQASPLALAAVAAASAATALAVAVCIAIVGYVAISYALMLGHVQRRSAAVLLREVLRELGWAVLTQPIMPLFYLAGRRLSRLPGPVPIVAVHGYMQNRVDFLRIAGACGRAGLGPVYGFNYPWFGSIRSNADRLARFVDDVCRETGASQVDLVAHSLGGLIAMEFVHRDGGSRVRRAVTVASPHAGVAWRGPIVGACGPEMRVGCEFLLERADRAVPVPCLSVYSTHDNIVHPPQTSALARRGGLDRSVEHVGHLAILFHRDTVNVVVSFLSAPAPDGGLLPDVDASAKPASAVCLEPDRELIGA